MGRRGWLAGALAVLVAVLGVAAVSQQGAGAAAGDDISPSVALTFKLTSVSGSAAVGTPSNPVTENTQAITLTGTWRAGNEVTPGEFFTFTLPPELQWNGSGTFTMRESSAPGALTTGTGSVSGQTVTVTLGDYFADHSRNAAGTFGFQVRFVETIGEGLVSHDIDVNGATPFTITTSDEAPSGGNSNPGDPIWNAGKFLRDTYDGRTRTESDIHGPVVTQEVAGAGNKVAETYTIVDRPGAGLVLNSGAVYQANGFNSAMFIAVSNLEDNVNFPQPITEVVGGELPPDSAVHALTAPGRYNEGDTYSIPSDAFSYGLPYSQVFDANGCILTVGDGNDLHSITDYWLNEDGEPAGQPAETAKDPATCEKSGYLPASGPLVDITNNTLTVNLANIPAGMYAYVFYINMDVVADATQACADPNEIGYSNPNPYGQNSYNAFPDSLYCYWNDAQINVAGNTIALVNASTSDFRAFFTGEGEPGPGTFVINKTGVGGTPLEGATFWFTNVYDWNNANPGGQQEVLASKAFVDDQGNPIALTTGADGRAISPELPEGVYYVFEADAPAGYEVNGVPDTGPNPAPIGSPTGYRYPAGLDWDAANGVSGEYFTTVYVTPSVPTETSGGIVTVTDTPTSTAFLSWAKTDGTVALGGATFLVTGDGGFSMTVADNGEGDLDPAEGAVRIAVLAGDYTITESEAPNGYVGTDAELTASVTDDDVLAESVIDAGTIVNELAPTSTVLSWLKTDGSGPLGGATFVVSGGPAGFVAVTVVDNGDGDLDGDIVGKIRIAVVVGTYTITETVAPDGYLGTDVELTATVTADDVLGQREVEAGTLVNTPVTPPAPFDDETPPVEQPTPSAPAPVVETPVAEAPVVEAPDEPLAFTGTSTPVGATVGIGLFLLLAGAGALALARHRRRV